MVLFWRSCRKAGAAWSRLARTGWHPPAAHLQAAGVLGRSRCLLASPEQRGSTPRVAQVARAGQRDLRGPRLRVLLVQTGSGLPRGQTRPWIPRAWLTAEAAVRRGCCWESARPRTGSGCCPLRRGLRRDWPRLQCRQRQMGSAWRPAARAARSHQTAQVGWAGPVDQNWEHRRGWLTDPMLRSGRSHFLRPVQGPKVCRTHCRHQAPRADQRHFLRRAPTAGRMHSYRRPEPRAGRILRVEPAPRLVRMEKQRWAQWQRC